MSLNFQQQVTPKLMLDPFAPFRSDLAASQSVVNEPFAVRFGTLSNEPFRVIQVDPDPKEPEGNQLPFENDLSILLLIAGVYALIKFLK